MSLRLNVHCDGPTCQAVQPYPEQNNLVLPAKAPKDWIVIVVDVWRQVHTSARDLLGVRDGDNTKYFCSPRCLTLFTYAWWLGASSVKADPILMEIRRLTTDSPAQMDELPA